MALKPVPKYQAPQAHQMGMWRTLTKPDQTLTYGAVDHNRIVVAIDAITRAGGAVMFGITSDGGAFSVCVLHKDQKMKEYPHTVESLEEFLTWLVGEFV